MQSTRQRNDKKWYTHTHTLTPKLICVHEAVTVLWNQDVQIDREVMANRPDIIINKTGEVRTT